MVCSANIAAEPDIIFLLLLLSHTNTLEGMGSVLIKVDVLKSREANAMIIFI
jgi:hypothetical protein